MSGLGFGLIGIVPLAPVGPLGGLIQLILAELERPADCQVDIPDQFFRYLDSYLYHPRTPPLGIWGYLKLMQLQPSPRVKAPAELCFLACMTLCCAAWHDLST
jgi:hypothetical protein